MRILHINVNYITSALHQTMIDHLNNVEGIENKVFVPTYDKRKSIVEPKEYVTIVECFKKWDRVLYFLKQKKIIESIKNSFNISEFNCLHAYTLFTDGNVAMQLSKQYDIPYVVAVRNTDVNDFFKKMIHLRSHGVKILQNASAVFFLSPVYRDLVLNKYVPISYRNEIRKKSYLIPNGIDDYWHKNRGNHKNVDANKKGISCIYVGNIDANKNIELTLQALSSLNAKGEYNTRLIVIGRIVNKRVFKKLSSYNIFDYVEPKKKEELIDYYRKADIFIMPSHTETFGLVYVEAMSQGIPVIYTKGQGFDGQFTNGSVGFAVSDKDPTEIEIAIQKIIKEYNVLSQNCCDGSRKYSWSVICKKYSTIYRRVID